MNFLLAREDAEKHAGTKSCFYCNKVFNNYRALGGHLRIHQEDKTLRILNYPGHSNNSMDITRNPPASPPNCQQNSMAGGNSPTPFTRALPPFDFSRMFCSNETNQARSKFTGGNPGVAQTHIIMSPDYSYGCGIGATYHHNIFASRAFTSAGLNAALSCAAFASSGSVVATGFSIDSSYLGSNGVCQFNTDEFQISRDGLPLTSGDALQNVQGYNLGNLPNPNFAITNSDLGLGSYQLSSFNESLVVCAFSPGPPPCLILDKEGKRPYVADGSWNAEIMNVSKKPKIAPNAHVEPENIEKKEISLFMDADDSIPASKACFVADEEGPEDVDLSLHL